MPLDPWRGARKGRDGRDADEDAIVNRVTERVLANMPRPRNGRDASLADLRRTVAAFVGSLNLSARKGGEDGDRGPRGFEGAIGPMPRHEWKDTQLRFEEEPGVWGKWVDLKGDRGEAGFGGVLVKQSGNGAPSNTYFPAGWP